MKAELITIGTELLLGEITDTNAVYIAQQLREIGIDLHYKTTVGDNRVRIAEVVNIALDRVDIVLTTGGLGPTLDDVTRESIADATGHPLEFQQHLLDDIAEKFRQFGFTMSDNNRRQAYIPQGGVSINNPVGTAPIFELQTERGLIFVFPGVPRELKYLMQNEILPRLRVFTGTPAVIRSRTLRTAGIGESTIDDMIGDLMVMSNPTVGLAAHGGWCDVRITAKAETHDLAMEMITPIEESLRARLGEWIFGVDTDLLEDSVITLLDQHGATVAIHEIGTRDSLRRRFDLAQANTGISVMGTAHDNGVLSIDLDQADAELKDQLAEAAGHIRTTSRATYGMVMTLYAQQREGRTILIGGAGVAAEGVTRAIVRKWGYDRPDAPDWVSTQALALLRRVINKTT